MSDGHSLPDNWTAARLEQLAEINPSRAATDLPPKALLDFVPMPCVAEELGGLTLRLRRPLEEVRKGYTQFKSGDVLYAKITPCMENGKVAVVPDLQYPIGYGSTEFHVVRAFEGIEAKWLAHFIAQHSLRREAKRNMTGSAGQLRVPSKWLAERSIPLPPANEQSRIVDKVEELLSDLDAGVAALERVKANLKRYRASVLKAAVEGRLTQSWRAAHRPTETGAQLLERILKERRRKWEEDQLAAFAAAGKPPPNNWRARYKQPVGPETAKAPTLPDGWCWGTLGQLLHGIEGGKSFKCLTRPANRNEWGVVKVSAMTWGTFLEDEQKAIPPSVPFDVADEIRRGDILLSRSNTAELVGATVLVGDCRPKLLLSDKSLRLLVTGSLNRKWLHAVLSSSVVRDQLSAMATGTSDSMRNVSQEKIEAVSIPLPLLAEQQIIVAELEERLSQVDAAKVRVKQALLRAARLRQSILKRAFAGQLVAQDPADEPAAVLLARIKQSQAATAASQSKGKQPSDEFLRRAAIVSYTVKRLAPQPSFGRTQLEKTLHLAQSHLGIDLGLKFERYAAGPFDKSIYRLESAAKKSGWFTKQNRRRFGVTYHPGPKIDALCQHAARLLGDKQADFDRLLDHMAAMNTDEAELFATAYAAWNDLLIDGRPADEAAIVAEVYGWHEAKKRFTSAMIRARLQWMRQNNYVPTGRGQTTRLMQKPAGKGARK